MIDLHEEEKKKWNQSMFYTNKTGEWKEENRKEEKEKFPFPQASSLVLNQSAMFSTPCSADRIYLAWMRLFSSAL